MNILKLLFNSTAVWGLILGFCFVILYYINYKNKYVLGLDKKEIIKKYKKLIITITCSPLIVFVLAFFDISRYADYFIYPNFILIFVMLLFILFNKKLSFYDTSIYIYTFIYTYLLQLLVLIFMVLYQKILKIVAFLPQ